MIRRTLYLVKSALVTGIAFQLFETLRPQPPAPSPDENEDTPSHATAPAKARKQPPMKNEVARPPVVWWLTASDREVAEMRVELRKKLGRKEHTKRQALLFVRMHNVRRRLARAKAELRQFDTAHLGSAPGDSNAAHARLRRAELHRTILEAEAWLQHARVRSRRMHESNSKAQAQRAAQSVLNSSTGALEAWLTHAPGAGKKI